jgi:site-specific recombinase XerD
MGKKLKIGKLAIATVANYKFALKYVRNEIRKILLSEIQKDRIISYRDRVASELSNVFSNKRLLAIKQFLNKGVELNVVSENPTEEVDKLNEKERERNRFLKPNELFALVDASRQTMAKNYLPAMVFFGAEHGASKQEILSLR